MECKKGFPQRLMIDRSQERGPWQSVPEISNRPGKGHDALGNTGLCVLSARSGGGCKSLRMASVNPPVGRSSRSFSPVQLLQCLQPPGVSRLWAAHAKLTLSHRAISRDAAGPCDRKRLSSLAKEPKAARALREVGLRASGLQLPAGKHNGRKAAVVLYQDLSSQHLQERRPTSTTAFFLSHENRRLPECRSRHRWTVQPHRKTAGGCRARSGHPAARRPDGPGGP